MINRDVLDVSEITSEKLAEKFEIFSTMKREAKETSSPKKHRRTSTYQKKSEYKPLECGKTTLLLNGNQTAFVRKRRPCSKNDHSVFLSLDNRKGELHWKTTVALTRPFEGLVAQRKTRLTTNQEIAGSIFSKVGDRLFTPTFSVFGETGQDYSVCRHTPEKFCCDQKKN